MEKIQLIQASTSVSKPVLTACKSSSLSTAESPINTLEQIPKASQEKIFTLLENRDLNALSLTNKRLLASVSEMRCRDRPVSVRLDSNDILHENYMNTSAVYHRINFLKWIDFDDVQVKDHRKRTRVIEKILELHAATLEFVDLRSSTLPWLGKLPSLPRLQALNLVYRYGQYAPMADYGWQLDNVLRHPGLLSLRLHIQCQINYAPQASQAVVPANYSIKILYIDLGKEIFNLRFFISCLRGLKYLRYFRYAPLETYKDHTLLHVINESQICIEYLYVECLYFLIVQLFPFLTHLEMEYFSTTCEVQKECLHKFLSVNPQLKMIIIKRCGWELIVKDWVDLIRSGHYGPNRVICHSL